MLFVIIGQKESGQPNKSVISYIEPETEVVEEEKVLPPVEPEFISIPEFRESEDSIYGDVLSHSQETPFGSRYGRDSNVHETAHGIHSYIRNAYKGNYQYEINGFYALEGRAVIIEEPNIRKSDVSEFVPATFQSSKYRMYIVGQRAWENPLYIYDEWTAYTLGAMTNVQDVNNGKYHGDNVGGVSGCLEFSIFAVATCMAVEKKDPEYWKNKPQLKNYTIWLLRRAHVVYTEGSKMSQFQYSKQDKILKEFLQGNSASSMRNFITNHLDGAWIHDHP